MSEWRPIETAPKDGTWVLLSGGKMHWDADSEPHCIACQWSDYLCGRTLPEARWMGAWYDSGYYGEYYAPTHWMPLPEPPLVIRTDGRMIEYIPVREPPK